MIILTIFKFTMLNLGMVLNVIPLKLQIFFKDTCILYNNWNYEHI